MKPAHTPAPWGYHSLLSASENHKGYYLTGGKGMTIGELRPLDPDGDEGRANAWLITAAPELLEACKAFEGYYDGAPDSSTRGMGKAYELACAAIAKAEKGVE